MVEQINSAELTVLRDSVKTDYPTREMSFRTYLTAFLKGTELKKYVNDAHSKHKENGVVSEMQATSAFYFDAGKLIKVEEKAMMGGKDHVADWYFENGKSVHYTLQSEKSEERVELLLKLAQGFLEKVKL